VVLITLNRPEAQNAVDPAMACGLEAAIDLLESEADLWAAVLTGAEPVFCAGPDLNTVAAGRLGDLFTTRGGLAGFVRRERAKPVVLALAGDAPAGGMEIAVAADLIVAGRRARLGIPEAARSLIAVGGGLAELPRLIGEKAALELVLTAQGFPASRLYELGLISPGHRRRRRCRG
jgi:enoyl-CoA hydratase